MKFLIVEDEAELLELYDIFLSDLDIQYKLAKDGLEALEILESDNFDYVFSDIRMPNMDGFELLENVVRKNIKLRSFIFITANVDISKEEIITKGAQDILYKPLAHKRFIGYIEELLK